MNNINESVEQLKTRFDFRGLCHSVEEIDELLRSTVPTPDSSTWWYILGYGLGLRLVAEDAEAAMQHAHSLTVALAHRDRGWDTWDSTNQGIIDAVEAELDTIIEK